MFLVALMTACKPAVFPPVANVNTPVPAATSTSIDTSTWKTYRNDEYGFEFKYPETFGGIPFLLFEDWADNGYGIGGDFKVIVRPLSWQDYMFVISVFKDTLEKVTEVQIGNFRSSLLTSPNVQKVKFKLEDRVVYGYDDEGTLLTNYTAIFSGNQFTYMILGGGCPAVGSDEFCKKPESQISLVNGMLSTMKLIE